MQEIDIFNIAGGASQAIQEEAGNSLKSQIMSTLVYDNRDSVYLTRHGHRITFTPHIAGGFLGGDVQTYGFDLEGSQYFLFPYDIILELNGAIGVVDTWGSGDHVPIFDRLFLGGADTLRGFDYRDVGPKDQNGEPLGGQTLSRLRWKQRSALSTGCALLSSTIPALIMPILTTLASTTSPQTLAWVCVSIFRWVR